MDDFERVLDAKVPDDFRPIVEKLRVLVRECAPHAAEVVLYGSPAWKGTRSMAIISVSKTHLTFAFDRGAEFDDPHGLLAGTGKKTRHVKLKSMTDVNEPALRDYITQAAKLDQQ
ncbi:DUF1801 domain-containing protein [Actinomadura adrarensis]|uniref:DUF1801 domain-containing protein n=1 Tax=Actinomadura adrarensis TaxID=1819600 RepID=A0ABW3CKJ2_9ACTN